MCCWHCRHVFSFRNISVVSASKTWPWPYDSSLNLSLGVLASALAFWPRLTSLILTRVIYLLKLCVWHCWSKD